MKVVVPLMKYCLKRPISVNMKELKFTIERDSGIISINGAAAHKARPEDIVIIATYSDHTELELATYQPDLVYVDDQNRIKELKKNIPAQAA